MLLSKVLLVEYSKSFYFAYYSFLIQRHQLLQGRSSCQGPVRLQVLGIDEYASQEEVKKDRSRQMLQAFPVGL